MKITVDRTYHLLFKYFDNREDSKRKKGLKLCASVAIGIFTLGIYHLTIGLWHRHNIKKLPSNVAPIFKKSHVPTDVQPVQKEIDPPKESIDPEPELPKPLLSKKELSEDRKSQFQLLKQQKDLQHFEPTEEERKVLWHAANEKIPEAIYLYCLNTDSKSTSYLRNIRALKNLNTPEAQYYLFLLSPSKDLKSFLALQDALLESDCEEGLYQLYCPRELSQLQQFRIGKNSERRPLGYSVSKGHPKAFYEYGRILKGDYGPTVQASHLPLADLSLSAEERLAKGHSLIEKAVEKGLVIASS